MRAGCEVEQGRDPKTHLEVPTAATVVPHPGLPVPQVAPADVPILSAEVVHYYLYCDQSLSSPFQQVQQGWALPLVLPGTLGGSWGLGRSL